MTDWTTLVKSTNAYNVIKSDIENDRLSHAYLVLCADGDNLGKYLGVLTKLFFCKEGLPCGKCRSCGLIEQGLHPDANFFPKEGQTVLSDDVNAIVLDSYVKPYEADKKVYVINHGQTMNASSQNKLLKTLEEPPQNVHIIIGATGEYSLLPTVLSRVKKLEIAPFDDEVIFNALKDELTDVQRLKDAISCADGSVGKVTSLYNDLSLKETMDFCQSVILDMQSSKDVLEFSTKLSALKGDFNDFLSVMELFLRDMLVAKSKGEKFLSNANAYLKLKSATGFSQGALISILEHITEARRRLQSNVTKTMVGEWLLFKILEDKFKWQR